MPPLLLRLSLKKDLHLNKIEGEIPKFLEFWSPQIFFWSQEKFSFEVILLGGWWAELERRDQGYLKRITELFDQSQILSMQLCFSTQLSLSVFGGLERENRFHSYV